VAQASLARRLLITLLGTVTAVWLATAAYSYWDTRHEVNELLDAHLAQSAALLVAQAGDELEEGYLEHAPQLHRYGRRVAFQIWEHDEGLRLHSFNAPNERLSAVEEGFSDSTSGGRRWRVFSAWNREHRFLIQVGEQTEARDEIAARIGKNLLMPLLLALAALGVLIYFGVRSGTRPLTSVSRQLAQRDPGNLEPVMLANCPAEIAPLVGELNALFERVHASIENERRFTADAAHELRTPIAALRIQAQVARAASDEAERQHALDNVIAGCERAARLVDQLLTLARLEPGAMQLQRLSCDLHALAKTVVADIAPAAIAKDIEVELEDHAPALVSGDPALLQILIRNLVDNAVRYSAARTTVRVRTQTADGEVVLRVTDEGRGVPAGEMERLGSRFYRALGTGESGSGLGLSIVKRIAELHHARVSFQPAPNGNGLRAAVAFATSHSVPIG
jgi:two-component system sensor histidine kinase QseC